MKEWNGFRWPDADKDCALAIVPEATRYMGKFLAHVPRQGTAVQAGGNVGVYPIGLAQVFRVVHTFEPEWENFRCLCANLDTIETSGVVIPYKAALGDEIALVGLRQNHDDNTGTFQVHGPGKIQMQTIDALELPECDLIWLDVEGSEMKALRGAAKTIDRHQPVIIIEDNGLTADGEETGAAIEWLLTRGYRKVVKHGNDVLLTPSDTKKD